MVNLPLNRRTRNSLQVAIPLITLVLLALPVIVVARSGSASADPLWTALRLMGVEAFTLVFLNIATGSFRVFFVRALGSHPANRLHIASGAVGLAAAASHGLCAFVFGITGYRIGAIWVGPIVLALLATVMATALLRMRLRRSWRWVHRVNYLVFAAIAVHGGILGSDLWHDSVLKVLLLVYSTVVLAGLTKRSVDWLSSSRRVGNR